MNKVLGQHIDSYQTIQNEPATSVEQVLQYFQTHRQNGCKTRCVTNHSQYIIEQFDQTYTILSEKFGAFRLKFKAKKSSAKNQ